MLLLNICVLVGALLTPPSLRWLYSTCILLLCLYQIFRKDWLGLFIVTISLVALISSNSWREWTKNEVEGPFYWDVEQACLRSDGELENFSLIVRDKGRSFEAGLCDRPASSELLPVRLNFARLFGDYREHLAYVKGVDALLYLPKQAQQTPLPLKLDQYPSWRFAYSIIKGDRSRWDERDRWLINYLGITHLFVVSGLHVGFVCMLALAASRLFWRFSRALRQAFCHRAWLDWLMAVPASFAYAYWSGLGEPAIRAALMALVFLTIRAMYHKVALLHVLGFCAWLMLLQWPGRVLDPSFWLSFSFVLLIALLLERVKGRGRMLWVQCLMSFFALLLTLGWQSSLSPLVVVINLLLIPFVAFVWFPISLISLLELSCCNTSYLYGYLDSVLLWSYEWIEAPLYQVMAITPNHEVMAWVKLTMIGLGFWGVYWLPSRRSLGFLMLLLLAALLSPLTPEWTFQWYKDRYQVVSWNRDVDGQVAFNAPTVVRLGEAKIALNPTKEALAERALVEGWHIAVVDNEERANLLRAMQVNVLSMREGERLSFYLDAERWRVESSDCYQILNLVKTVACEHAEWLESVLNYPQFDTGGLGVRAF